MDKVYIFIVLFTQITIFMFIVTSVLYVMRKQKIQIKQLEEGLVAAKDHYRKEAKTLSRAVVMVGRKLLDAREMIEEITRRQNESEARHTPTTSYNQAAKMIEIGGKVEDIMTSCGLTRAEAELIAKLNQKAALEN